MRKEIIFILFLLIAKSLGDSEEFQSAEEIKSQKNSSESSSSSNSCSSETSEDSSCSESCSESDSSCDDSDDDSCSKKSCSCECSSSEESTTRKHETTSSSSTTFEETSTSSEPNVCEGQISGYVPNENNCTLYYYCELEITHPRSCEEGLIFNPESLNCEPGDAESCTLLTTTESTSTSVSSTQSSTVPQTSTQSPTQPPTTTEFPQFYCECPIDVTKNNILIPSPYSCEHYYECIWGVAYRRDCPEGLYFDAPTDTCVNPEDAHCGQAVDCIVP